MPSSAYASAAASSLYAGSPKRITAGTPIACSSEHSDTSSSTERWYWPGIEGIGSRRPDPCRTNSGAIMSAGDRRVSLTIDRSASVRRNRRILVAGKPMRSF